MYKIYFNKGYTNEGNLDKIYKLLEVFPVIEPDLTFIIDIEPEVCIQRIIDDINNDNRDTSQCRLDLKGLEYHTQVYNGYMEIYKNNKHRVKLIDGNGSIEEIHKKKK